jgi:hypothetical protein
MTRHLRDVALLLLLGENSRRVASTDGGGGGGRRRREYGVSSGIEVEDDDDEVESNEVPASLALEEVIPSTSTSSSSTSTSFSSSSLSSSSLRDRRANGDSLRRRRRLIGSADGNDDNGDGDLIDNNNNIFYPSPIRLMRGELLKQQRLGRRATSSYEVGGAVTAPGCGPTPGTHHSPYLGCYSDKKDDRAFPYELYGGMPSRFEHGALDCERECTKRGFRYFGREYIGQCFCGNAIDDITRHGMDDGCDCCGTNVGEGKMCVWEVRGVVLYIIAPYRLSFFSCFVNHERPTIYSPFCRRHYSTPYFTIKSFANDDMTMIRTPTIRILGPSCRTFPSSCQ